MAPIIAILTQRPSHDTADLPGGHDLSELAADEVGSIPGPEDIVGGVVVVFAALTSVELLVGLGCLPASGDGEAVALTVQGVAAGATVGIWVGAAVFFKLDMLLPTTVPGG